MKKINKQLRLSINYIEIYKVRFFTKYLDETKNESFFIKMNIEKN